MIKLYFQNTRYAKIILLILALLACSMHAPYAIAGAFTLRQHENPKDLLKQIYDCEVEKDCIRPHIEDMPVSKTLGELLRKMREREKNEEEGWVLSCFDADPVVNAQDASIGKYVITSELHAASRARLTVLMFKNYQEEGTGSVTFEFVQEDDQWKIDDILRESDINSAELVSLRRDIEECVSTDSTIHGVLHITAGASVLIPAANKTLSVYDDEFSVRALAEKFRESNISFRLEQPSDEPFITVSIDGYDAAIILGDLTARRIASIQFSDIYGFSVIDPYGTKLGDPLSEAVGKNALCYSDANGSPYCVNPRRPHLRFSEGDIDNTCPSLEAVTGSRKVIKIRECSTVGIIEITRLEPGEN